MKPFTHHPWNIYHITGRDRRGKKFKIVTSNPYEVIHFELWTGTKWQVNKKTGKRRILIATKDGRRCH